MLQYKFNKTRNFLHFACMVLNSFMISSFCVLCLIKFLVAYFSFHAVNAMHTVHATTTTYSNRAKSETQQIGLRKINFLQKIVTFWIFEFFKKKYKQRRFSQLIATHTYLGRAFGIKNPRCTVRPIVIAQRRLALLRTSSDVSRP